MPERSITIREESTDDVEGIGDVNQSAFPTSAEANLVDALRAADELTVSLIAEVDGAIVGHIAFSPVSIDGERSDPPALGLAPVAVRPEWQQRGIGSRLVRAGLDALRKLGTPLVVVLGEPGYYERFGFERADEHGLENVYGAGPEFRVVESRPGALDGVSGVVRYSAAFDELA